MVEAKHVSGKNIYWSTFIGKSKERKFFDFLHCPFEPPAKQHRPVSQLGWILWCMLARPSKGQCTNSKIFPPLLLIVNVDQNIFFLETCFASTISEPEFTVCTLLEIFNMVRRSPYFGYLICLPTWCMLRTYRTMHGKTRTWVLKHICTLYYE